MPLEINELLQPIAGETPGGADIRFEPVFHQIKTARTEDPDLPAGDWIRERKTADYPLVVKLATEVLSERSKDLQVAAWLTEALLHREGFAGLESGLELLTSLLTTFWDDLHPAAEDGDLEFRAAPLEWVAQYLAPAVRMTPISSSGHTLFDYRDSRAVGYEADAETSEEQEARQAAIDAGKITAEEFDQGFEATPKVWFKQLIAGIDSALAAVDRLELVGKERFGEVAPHYGLLREAIGEVRGMAAELLARKLEVDPDPSGPDPAGTGSPPPLPEDRTGPEPAPEPESEVRGVDTAPTAPRTRPDAEALIAAAARFLRSADPKNPAPYLLLRGFRWGELRANPEGVDPRLLAAPPTELRARLRGLLLDGRWAHLLETAEGVMATPFGRGWLDLQRYVLAACTELGSDYAPVAAAVRGALRDLLRELPQLPSLALMDETPTANAETQALLRELAPAPDSTETAAEDPRPITYGGMPRRSPYDRALEQVRAGAPEKGVELLIRLAAEENSARERFLRRSEAAAIMVGCGREAVALPILEDLLAEIDKHALDEWEAPETIARPLGLLYRCLLQLQGESSTTESLYLRICRLDPLEAIQLAGQPEP